MGVQHGISLPRHKWDWIYSNYRKHGFQFHSRMIEYCFDYTVKNDPKFSNPNGEALKELEKFDEIGKISAERREKKFSLVHAVNDFKEDLKGFKQLLDEEWITREQHDELVEETEEHHKKVVQVELSKKRSGKKKKKRGLAYYQEQLRLHLEEKSKKSKYKFMKTEDWKSRSKKNKAWLLRELKEYANEEEVTLDEAYEKLVGDK